MKTILLITILTILSIVNSRTSTCTAQGDPHYRTFSGRTFDNMWEGTFVLAKTQNFLVHIKTGIWNKHTSVITGTGIKCPKGNKFVFDDKYNNHVKVNGRKVSLNHGRNTIKGLIIDKQGSSVYARAGNEWVSVQVNYHASWKAAYGQEQYQNVAVFGEVNQVGICGDKGVITGKGVFNHYKRRKVIDVKPCLRSHVEQAKVECAKKFGGNQLGSQGYEWCIFDVCRGLRASWVANYEKQVSYLRKTAAEYERLRKHHSNLAKEYLKKSLYHLEHMKVHSREYREHSRKSREYENQRNSHNRNRNQHETHRNRAGQQRDSHNREYEKNHKLYIQFRNQSEHWGRVIAQINRDINRCREEINRNEKKKADAFRQFNYYNQKATAHKRAADAHKRSAQVHHNAYLHHQKWERHYSERASESERKRKYHAEKAQYHLKQHQNHERQHKSHKSSFEKAAKEANKHAQNVKDFDKKIRDLVSKQESERKTEINVEKSIHLKSRKCKTTPKYLDSVKFSTASAAKAHALNVCRHSDKNVEYSCTYDHAQGIFNSKEEYVLLASLLKQNENRYTCYSWGDPHNKAFIGNQVDVYNKQGWTDYLKTKNIHIQGYLSYSQPWGTRSINRYLIVREGAGSIVFNPHGHFNVYHCSGWRVVQNHGHYKEWARTIGNFNIKVTWHHSVCGGYYSLWVDTKLGDVRGCTGECCNQHTNEIKSKKQLKQGNSNNVKFQGPCKRKTRAYNYCSFEYRTISNQSQRHNLIKNCVATRKDK